MCKSEGSEGYFREIFKEFQQVRPVVRKPGTLFIDKYISFNPQRYIFEKPFLYLLSFKHIGMKTGPVFKIKYVNQIQYESKERHASNKPGTFWTKSIYFLINKYIHFRQKVLTKQRGFLYVCDWLLLF